MENTSLSWFLGSNSARGFHSLYEGFPGEGRRLRIIKGGPGTGKSSFMRAIAAAAERAGQRVEYILCSGDPDSLDGILLPGLGLAYADGTAPHALDPAVFGADGDYIDLGAHCSERVAARSGELRALTAEYRRRYQRAYELLAAAAKVSPALSGCLTGGTERAAARSRAAGVAHREMPRSHAQAKLTYRFLGGLTCAGRVTLGGTLASLAPRLFMLDNRLGLGFEFTAELARQARERGAAAIICPHWLCPEKVEAVLLPESGAGWCVTDPDGSYPEQHRRLHLDRMAGAAALRAARSALREDEKLEESLLRCAGDCLAAAKAGHDALEAVYRPYVDFDALTAAAEAEIRRLGL